MTLTVSLTRPRLQRVGWLRRVLDWFLRRDRVHSPRALLLLSPPSSPPWARPVPTPDPPGAIVRMPLPSDGVARCSCGADPLLEHGHGAASVRRPYVRPAPTTMPGPLERRLG